MESSPHRGRKKGSRQVTQRDVAAWSGVTQATVSMVVNNDHRVRPETRERVLRAIEELGYVPNLAARGLAARRSRALAIVTPDLRHESEQFLMPVIQGIMDGLGDRDYFLNLAIRREGEDARTALFRTVREGRLDGIFILSPHFEELTYLDFLLESEVPFVLVNRRSDDPAVPCIHVDHMEGARIATAYLLEKGHRSVACLAGPQQRPASVAKLRGFRKACEDAGFPCDPGLVLHGDFQIQGGLNGMRQLLRLGKPFTAVYAGNDFQALGALQAATEEGLEVPEQMAIIGCDDWEMAAWVRPALTTIRVPFYDMGVTAADILCRMAEGDKVESRQICLPVELIPRKSA